MALMNEGDVVALYAQASKNEGECIGSHNRHLVFLPRGTEAGKEYRVRLQFASRDAAGAPKKDKAGRELFRGVPAPVMQSDRWRDNRDGTLSHLFVTTDWKLAETVSVMTTRPKVTREGDGFPVVSHAFEWGTSLATAQAVVSTKISVPTYEECVDQSGKLAETRGNDRDAGTVVQRFPIISVEVVSRSYTWDDFGNHRLLREYAQEMTAVLRVVSSGYAEALTDVPQPFNGLPAWLQAHLTAPYPICACDRARVDTVAGHVACELCRVEAERLAMVETHLPSAQREAFAQMAQALATAGDSDRAWEGEAGAELVLALTEERRPAGAQTDGWREYPWYYLLPDGSVHASRFPPIAMHILSGLNRASGSGLLMLACWLASEHRTNYCGQDFYARTQIANEELEARPDSYVLPTARISVLLCGSQAAYDAANMAYLEACRRKLEVPEAAAQFECLEYAEAARLWQAAIDAHVEIERQQAAGIIYPDFTAWCRRGGMTNCGDGWVIGSDGALRDPDESPWSGRDGTKRWVLVHEGELALRWTKECAAKPHCFEVVKLPMSKTLTPEQRETVARIEQELEDAFAGARGFSSGTSSPSVGNGWGLGTRRPAIAQTNPWGEEEPAPLRSSAQDVSAKFTFKSERHFMCQCGKIVKMGRPEWNRYQSSGRGFVQCSCGTSGDVFRSAAPAPAPTSKPPPSRSASGGTFGDLLRNRSGR